jgi:PAS domain S-box-containing protein
MTEKAPRVRRLRLQRYVVVVAAVFVLVLMRLLLAPVLGNHFRFTMLLPAVVFSAWYGGLDAGLLATGLSAGAAAYLLDPTHSFGVVNAEDLTALCLFALIGGFISLLSENLIQARRGLERSLGALQRRARHATLAADVGAALTGSDTVQDMLQRCAEAIVRHLVGAFARIWTLGGGTDVLELQASAGMYNHLDGAHSRVPVGKLKVGMIAAERKPYLTNAVIGDPQVDDQEWARREGMVAFAGYPLVVEDRLVGVMAMFARWPLRESVLTALGSVANQIALGIERKRAEAALRAAYEELDRRVEERTAELAESNALLRQEIAEHRQAEDALRESEQRFKEFMQNLPGVAFIKDVDGRYVWVNPTFERISGVALQDYAGKTDDELWPAATAAQLRENDQTVLRTGQTLRVIQVVPQDDGPHYWLTSKFPIVKEDGAPRMVAGVAIDITEQRRAEAQLRELERVARQRDRLADIGAITAQIVHDLGNPLAGLSMQAQLALHRAQRDERQPVGVVLQPLERIVAEVHRLDERIKEFMEFSHEQRLELKAIDLERLLHEVVGIWQPVAAERGIGLSMETSDGALSLTADAEKLRRVFDNLVKNAIEAIDHGPGQVAIQVTAPRPEAVRIAVSDTGPGIPDTVQAFRLFETTKANGSGLGLAVVKQIVLAHRGTIQYSNSTPHGTVFRIELPRTTPSVVLEGNQP